MPREKSAEAPAAAPRERNLGVPPFLPEAFALLERIIGWWLSSGSIRDTPEAQQALKHAETLKSSLHGLGMPK